MNNQNKNINKNFSGNTKLEKLFEEKFCSFDYFFENNNTVIFDESDSIKVLTILQDNSLVKFEILIDLIAIDYSDYEVSEWNTKNANNLGYSRGIKKDSSGRYTYETAKKNFNQPKHRFSVIYNLLSVTSNTRLNVKVYCKNDENPTLPSVTSIWSSANWYEREAYDLFGIIFSNHPDLRRLLTDYGFIGYPLRKDFPLIGNVEVNYDLKKERVIYQPVTIKPRVLIPKVIRDTNKEDDKNAWH